jgi:RHS repeat-associated protein
MSAWFHWPAKAKQLFLLAVCIVSWLVPTAPALARCYNPAASRARLEDQLREKEILTAKTACTGVFDPGLEVQIGLLRWYDPNLQRFINRDPIGEAGGINLYRFVGNDPINWIDPWGFDNTMASLLADEDCGINNSFTDPNTGETLTGTGVLGRMGSDLASQAVLNGALWGGGKVLGPILKKVCGPVGRTLSKCKFLGKGAAHLHHPIAKFLGGDANQILTKLEPKIHTEFHDLLRQNLKDAGIPLNVGGRGGSAADWARYMQFNPGAQRTAFDAVLDASRAIDVKYGTEITQDVWKNLIPGNFTPYP